jgi:hypothetical protein
MLTLQECRDFSDLSQEEVREIAEHEHLPEVLAAALGHALLKTPNGVDIILGYLLQNLERAAARGDLRRVSEVAALITRVMTRRPSMHGRLTP